MHRTISRRSPANRQLRARVHRTPRRLAHRLVGSAVLGATIAFAGWLPATPARALDSDRNQPIRIESDRAERNEKAGTTIYIGDVNLRQGTLLIRSDRLEIHTKNNDVTDVIATGKPAYMEQQPKPGKPLVKARGDTINYYVSKDRLNLKGNASVEQEGSIVRSDVIDYYLDSEVIKAHGGITSANKRVHVVIPPSRVNEEEQKSKATEKPAPAANSGQQAETGTGKKPANGSGTTPATVPTTGSGKATPATTNGKAPASNDKTSSSAPASPPSGGG